MKKYRKTAMQGIVLAALAFLLSMNMEMKVNAETKKDSGNGVEYEDSIDMSVGYANDSSYGGGAVTYIYLDMDGDRVGKVTSSNPNLLVKKTRESYSNTTTKDWETNQKITKNNYRSAYLSFFAKKAGEYTVTFEVLKADGSVRCTKNIQVKAVASGSYASPIKSIKYNGKNLYNYYPYTTIPSGKLSVKLKKQYKRLSIEVGVRNKSGKVTYKKVENNKKIKLAKKAVYSYSYNFSNGSAEYTYDELFPTTYIRITYQNRKTGKVNTWTTCLYYLNKKQSWKNK